jgi:amino acid adenylation domain-containing protein
MNRAGPTLRLGPNGDPAAETQVGLERRCQIGGKYPLSFQQRSLWFLQQLDPSDCSYNEGKVLRISGALDRACLEAACRDLVDAHHVLRTVYTTDNGSPVQVIRADPAFRIGEIALSQDGRARTAEALDRIGDCARRPFDLEHDIPIRADLYTVAPDDHLLHISMHHIATDGWSWPILLEELFSRYAAQVTAGRSAAAPPPNLQYADYALWQRKTADAASMQRALDYWSGELEDLGALDLPTDRRRPARPSHRGGAHTFALPGELGTRCRRFARTHRTTPFIVLLSAFKLLLARLSGQDDIAVGVPVANRTEAELEPMIGLFVNTVAARSRLARTQSFRDLVLQVRGNWLGSLEHQGLPFDRVVSALRPDRDLARNPIFQVLFSFLRTPRPEIDVPGLSVDAVPADFGTARFDVELSLHETADLIEGQLIYNSDVFDPDTASRMAAQYLMLLDTATADPDASIWQLPMLSDEERRRVLCDWNRTSAAYPEQTIHALFERRARLEPNRLAIGGGGRAVTVAELNAHANRIAAMLRQMGVTAREPVALHLKRSIDYVAACLAVLKAGGAFVPIDSSLPAARRLDILNDCGAAVVVTHADATGLELPAGLGVLDLHIDAESTKRESPADPPRCVGADDAAYILYTSGSTGRPRGVVGLHRGLVNRLEWMQATYPFDAGDICAAKTAIGFVDSVTEIFGPLVHGAQLVILDDAEVRELDRFVRALRNANVTRIVLVPSLLRMLLETVPDIANELPCLQFWTSSGEALSQDLADLFHRRLPGRTLLNLYGSTEVSGDATAALIAAGEPVTIGRPIANTWCYVLDDCGQPAPIGVRGALHVGGVGLARGYAGHTELTAARFPTDPFAAREGARMFRTGDRARYLPDGRIEFLGRDDTQVKLRGVRIELREIESALRALDGVADALVVPVPNANAPNHLVAHVRPDRPFGGSIWAAGLRADLARVLPAAFVPARIVTHHSLPTTPSGKIDRLACSHLNRTSDLPPANEEQPATSHELLARLLEIWREELSEPAITADANFFEFGGHSLLAVKLVARIEETFGLRLPLATLFDAPTVRQLADSMRTASGGATAFLLEQTDLDPRTPPLFCLHGLFVYRHLARALRDIVPTFGVYVEAHREDGAGLSRDDGVTGLAQLAHLYVEEIVRIRPEGPFYLAGLSGGGVIAIEAARQLKTEGHDVALVALLDTNGPRTPFQARIGDTRDQLRRLIGRPVPKLAGMKMMRRLYDEAYGILHAAPYPGSVLVCRAGVSSFGGRRPDDLGWHPYIAGDVIVQEVPGDHLGILQPPNVEELGRVLRRHLASA